MRFAFARSGRLLSKAEGSASECSGTWILASRQTGARWAKTYGYRTHALGTHRTARLPSYAPDEPLASTAVVSHLDDPRHPDGRWLALVWARDHVAGGWRPAKIFRRWGSRERGAPGDFCFQSVEETEPAAAALPTRAPLLVEGAPPGPVLVSIRAHNDRVFRRAGRKLLLPFAGMAALFSGDEHCCFPRGAGNAFRQRRAGRNGSGGSAGMRVDHNVRVARLGLNNRSEAVL